MQVVRPELFLKILHCIRIQECIPPDTMAMKDLAIPCTS
jgi:hypothetical protein